MISDIILYDWRFENSRNGAMYLTGYLAGGKAWETSDVWKLTTKADHYEVTTMRSVYRLYW